LSDTIGGPAAVSLALYNTPLSLTSLTDPNLLFSPTAQGNLTNDGYTIIGINESFTDMITGNVVTTYKFNTKGDPDVSFKYDNYIDTGYLGLEFIYKNLKSGYSQFRLTSGDLINNRAITNSPNIKAKVVGLYRTLSGKDFMVTPAGTEAERFFSSNLEITPDIATGQVTITGQLPILTQVRRFDIAFQLSFTIGG